MVKTMEWQGQSLLLLDQTKLPSEIITILCKDYRRVGEAIKRLEVRGAPAIGAASALMNGYLGMQNYGLAKDQFNFQKDAFNKNWAAQSKLTNASLSDRQAARVASNPTAYQSVSDYMKANGV